MKNFLRKYYRYIILIVIVIISLIISFITYYNNHKVTKDFSKIDLTGVDKLMIVAHPDDEILWGGAHLIEDDYLVVCITCGVNQVRVKEFVNVMNRTEDKYIMLGYPDKTNGERDNWDDHRTSLAQDIKEIINLKDWNIVVTHNPDGEYGHIHHKMTNKITTDMTDEKYKLYYFGHYYSKRAITKELPSLAPINENSFKTKKNIIGLYKSQKFIQTMFDHMYEYEEWIPYSEWSEKAK